MTPLLVDTNVLLRHFLGQPADLAARAGEWLEPIRTGDRSLVLDHAVVVEAIHSLDKVYRVSRLDIAAAFVQLLHYRGIAQAERTRLLLAFHLYAKSNADWLDCLLVATGRLDGLEIASFDPDITNLKALL